MEIDLTPEQESFVHMGIEQGRFSRAEDAIKEALALWERRERARIELLAEVDSGDTFDGSEMVLDSEESIASMLDGVKQRGRSRLASL
jgi:putative addiction module CopG family antidote